MTKEEFGMRFKNLPQRLKRRFWERSAIALALAEMLSDAAKHERPRHE
jgi:hypothetical protein